MYWVDLRDTAINSLKANKLRTALMLLGLVIGVATTIIVVAIGFAGQKKIEKELHTFGINSIWIWRDWNDRKDSLENLWNSNNEISNKDVEALEKQSLLISKISPILFASLKVNFKNDEKLSNVIGITPFYNQINNEKVVFGRLLSEFDQIYRRKVCLLSAAAKNNLFKNILNPVGEKIRINKEIFTVIGILAKKDRAFLESIRSVGGSNGDEIYIPLSIVQDLHKTKNLSIIQVESLPGKSQFAIKQMEEILNRRHQGRVKFKTETMEQYVKISERIMGTLSLVLGAIASISLFVGGLGIMNIMLVSVTERTKEIGVRKAVGATKNEIILQFLMESISISLIGGGFGMVLGMVGVGLITIITGVSGLLSLMSISVAFLSSVLVGVLAGIYPAFRAAEMDTIEALRYE